MNRITSAISSHYAMNELYDAVNGVKNHFTTFHNTYYSLMALGLQKVIQCMKIHWILFCVRCGPMQTVTEYCRKPNSNDGARVYHF